MDDMFSSPTDQDNQDNHNHSQELNLDQDQISELNEKISNLLTMVLEKDARIVTLENKVASMSSILDIVSQQVPSLEVPDKKQKRSRGKAEVKLEFYKEHKDDPEVLEEINVFKKTFHINPPWQFRKSITDAMFEKSLAV